MEIEEVKDWFKIVNICFSGCTIAATRKKLTEILGEPDNCGTADDKVQYEWIFKINGKILTIYDWKEYRLFDENEVINWHIGANKENNISAEFQYLK